MNKKKRRKAWWKNKNHRVSSRMLWTMSRLEFDGTGILNTYRILGSMCI